MTIFQRRKHVNSRINPGKVRAHFIDNQSVFYQTLAEMLIKTGIKLTNKQIYRIYGIATQLFHRLWWSTSENQNRKYKFSQQGETYEELLEHYKNLQDFPFCLLPLIEIVRGKIKEECFRSCDELKPESIKDLRIALTLFKEKIEGMTKVHLHDLKQEIKEIKAISHQGENKGLKHCRKRELKTRSITEILIPIIELNSTRRIVDKPNSFFQSLLAPEIINQT